MHDSLAEAAARRAAPRRARPAVWQTKTPLPAASPSALTTQAARATGSVAAVGTPGGVHHVLGEALRALDPRGVPRSARTRRCRRGAARRRCRRRAAPRARSRRDRPRSRARGRAGRRRPRRAPGGTCRGSRCRGCPGAACSSREVRLRAMRQARACSRAPEPTRSTFTGRVYSALPDVYFGRGRRRRTRRAGCEVVRIPGGDAVDAVAVEEPLEIRIGGTAGGGDHAHAGPRRGARARLRALRGSASRGRAAARRPRCEHGRARRSRLRPGPARRGASTRRPRAASAARGRSRRSPSKRRGSRAANRVPADAPRGSPRRLRARQAAFEATGGLHATGLFDRDGELLCLREDVGRHNAMDKVVGWAFGRGCCRSPSTSSASAVGSRSSSCRRLRSPAARCSSRSALRRRSPIELGRRSRRHALRLRPRRPAERLHRAVANRRPDGGAARRRREPPLRLAEGARRARRGDPRRSRPARPRGGVRRGARRRQDGRAAVRRPRRRHRRARADRGRRRRPPCRRSRRLLLPPGRLPLARRQRPCAGSATPAATLPCRRPARCLGRRRRSALPVLEARLAAGGPLALHRTYERARRCHREVDPAELADVDTPDELTAR